MQAYHDLFRRLVKVFGIAGLDYVFTGALAASFYGLPRTSTDIDVVVRISGERAKRKLVQALRHIGVKADEKDIDRALASGYRIATFTDSKTAYSIDVIFSSEKLKKRAGTVAGVKTFFQTPEDLISAKLRMIKITVPKERALKDEDDIRAVLKFTRVDIEAVRKKAKKENTLPIFDSLITSKGS
jgi:hypothetical protein